MRSWNGVRVAVVAALACNCTTAPPPAPESSPASFAARAKAWSFADDGSFALRQGADVWKLETRLPPTKGSDRSARKAVIERGEVVETLKERNGTVEQSWTFAQMPQGSDPLTMRVRTYGASFESQDGSGLHFRGAGARTRFRYGNPTWVDANGTRTPARLSHEGNDVVISLARSVLAQSAYPAVLDPSVGSENEADPPTPGAAPPCDEISPSVVTVGDEFFLAWFDGRTSGISGARIDPQTCLPVTSDTTGVPYVTGALGSRVLDSDTRPGLASDGVSTVLLAWTEEHLDNNFYAYAERIDATTGAIFPADASGVQLGPAATSDNPAVGWDGREFIVAWSSGSGQSINAARFDAVSGANAEDGMGVAIGEGGSLRDVAVGCGGGQCLVGWFGDNDRFDIGSFGALLAQGASPNASTAVTLYILGSTAGPVGLGARPTGDLVGIGFDGTNFVAETVAETQVTQIFGGVSFPQTEYTPGASVVSPTLEVDQVAYRFSELTRPSSFAFDGSVFLSPAPDSFLIFDSGSEEFSSLASPSQMSEAQTAVMNGSVFEVGSVGAMSAFAASEYPSQIDGASFDATTLAQQTGKGGLESIGVSPERIPLVTNVGTAPLLVRWGEGGDGNADLVAARLDPTSGAPQVSDVPGTSTTQAFLGVPVPAAAIANDGTSAVVAFVSTANSVIALQAFNPTTATFGITTQSALSLATESVALASGAGMYMAATSDGLHVLATLFDGQTLTAGTSLVVSDGTLTAPSTDRQAPAIAFDGTNFLLVWQDGRSGSDAIYAAHVTPAGRVVEPDGIALSKSIFPQSQPAIAFAKEQGSLVVWRDTRNEGVAGDIFGRRLDASGSPLDLDTVADLAIGVGRGDQTTPVVVDAADGLSFQVAWVDPRVDPKGDIYGALVGYDGSLRQPNGAPLATSADAESAPSLAETSAGHLILAYVRHVSAVALGTDLVRTRALSTGLTSGKCTSDDDCATVHCADGRCCNSACNGSCESCDGATPGICTPVVSAVDPDTCSGLESCNASGACAKDIAQPCSMGNECVSGFCSDGVCCSSACSGGCDVCNATGHVGTCSVVLAGSTGANPSCLPETCDGTSASCPTACTSDAECVRPYTCGTDHVCVVLPGAICKDAQTLELSDGTLNNCAPYACAGSACLTLCHSAKECAEGSICDERGVCVAPVEPIAASGCDLARGGYGRTSAPVAGASAFALACLALRRRRGNSTKRIAFPWSARPSASKLTRNRGRRAREDTE